MLAAVFGSHLALAVFDDERRRSERACKDFTCQAIDLNKYVYIRPLEISILGTTICVVRIRI